MLLTQSTFRSQSYPPHAHDGYSLSLVTEGIHHFSVETERLKVASGEVRIIHPYELHETHLSSWSHINLSIETAQVEEAATALGLEIPVLFSRLIRDEALNALMRALYSSTTQPASCSKTLCAELLTHLLKNHLFAQEGASDTPPSPEMLQAKRYLHAHAGDTALSLDATARQAHMSKYYFLRRFKQTFGRTPYHYLQNIRIDCVRQKIRQGASLSQAAQSCGFYDQSHMIRIYRKFYGHTPGMIQRTKAQ